MVATHYPRRTASSVSPTTRAASTASRRIPIWQDALHIPPPEGRNWPSCYVRLRAFSAEARHWFGDRYVSLDLDTVICGDLTPLFERPEDFVIWNETDWPASSTTTRALWLHTPGTRTEIWDTFDPDTSPAGGLPGRRAGRRSSVDLARARAGRAGLHARGRRALVSPPLRGAGHGGRLPAGARVVNFHGVYRPVGPARASAAVGEASTTATQPLASRAAAPAARQSARAGAHEISAATAPGSPAPGRATSGSRSRRSPKARATRASRPRTSGRIWPRSRWRAKTSRPSNAHAPTQDLALGTTCWQMAYRADMDPERVDVPEAAAPRTTSAATTTFSRRSRSAASGCSSSSPKSQARRRRRRHERRDELDRRRRARAGAQRGAAHGAAAALYGALEAAAEPMRDRDGPAGAASVPSRRAI